MNYKSFNLGDWIGHISGAIEDERELDDNEMRDLVEFLTTLTQEPILGKARAEIEKLQTYKTFVGEEETYVERDDVLAIIDKYKGESGE